MGIYTFIEVALPGGPIIVRGKQVYGVLKDLVAYIKDNKQYYDLLDDGRSISTEALVNKIVNKGDLDKVNK